MTTAAKCRVCETDITAFDGVSLFFKEQIKP